MENPSSEISTPPPSSVYIPLKDFELDAAMSSSTLTPPLYPTLGPLSTLALLPSSSSSSIMTASPPSSSHTLHTTSTHTTAAAVHTNARSSHSTLPLYSTAPTQLPLKSSFLCQLGRKNTYLYFLLLTFLFWSLFFLVNVVYLLYPFYGVHSDWDMILIISVVVIAFFFMVLSGLAIYGYLTLRPPLLLPYYIYQLFVILVIFGLGIGFMFEKKMWSANAHFQNSPDENFRNWLLVISYFIVHGPIGMGFAMVYRQLHLNLKHERHTYCG
ncbi:hypothetical protein HMI54_014271 [Coelomomyces lativittatus]|nr:hypothetical protein HMI56_006973 [Coelomomyces lativittatus]KAJ1510900.1 hypothetical protein HMI55_006802 [Coelomomyces lativittatus]KAJ1514338.1 hypothetical protein HMI54_014271 [Coelomomyces lativittatus]